MPGSKAKKVSVKPPKADPKVVQPDLPLEDLSQSEDPYSEGSEEETTGEGTECDETSSGLFGTEEEDDDVMGGQVGNLATHDGAIEIGSDDYDGDGDLFEADRAAGGAGFGGEPFDFDLYQESQPRDGDHGQEWMAKSSPDIAAGLHTAEDAAGEGELILFSSNQVSRFPSVRTYI